MKLNTIMLAIGLTGCGLDADVASEDTDEELSAPCSNHTVTGAIEAKFYALGGVSALGCPTINETATPPPRGEGRFNHFARGGSIYWTPGTGPHEVHGLIKAKWAAKGWERFLGFPTTDEIRTPSVAGAFNHFERGSVYWQQGRNQAFEIHGLIRNKWAAQGWENGPLGFPVTDEIGTPNKPGSYNHFEFGSIYYQGGRPEAFIVAQHMRDHCWGPTGFENGALGFPTEDTLVDSSFQRQRFEHGQLTWLEVSLQCSIKLF